MNKHWYYLHTNGDLIYKKLRPDPSDFVRKIWEVNMENRATFWMLMIEAHALGANENRIKHLINHWNINDEDAKNFINHFVDKEGDPLLKLQIDGDQYCATFADFTNLQESQAGFGPTALEAFSDLVRPGLTRTAA